jgi:hypothetical protein
VRRSTSTAPSSPRLGEAENTTADVSAATAANTVVPAGGVAVLYDGDGSAFNDQLFRQAWSLGAGVPLIAVDGFPALANSGTGRNFGLWTDATAYAAALADDGEGTQRVSSFAGAAYSAWTTRTAFPAVSAHGPLDRLERRGLLWRRRQLGCDRGGERRRHKHADRGGRDAGEQPARHRQSGTRGSLARPRSGLLISEIMYDPASA